MTLTPAASTTPSWRRPPRRAWSVVYEGTFTDDTATDFSVQLADAQSAGADLVFMPIYYHARFPRS